MEDEAFKSSNHDAEVDCLICPNGHYNDIVGSNKCIECDPGRYIDDAGATVTKHNAKSSCLACAVGQYAINWGTKVKQGTK